MSGVFQRLVAVSLTALLSTCLLPDAVWQAEGGTGESVAAAGAGAQLPGDGAAAERAPPLVQQPAPTLRMEGSGGSVPLASPARGVAAGTADAGLVCSSASDCASAVCQDGVCAAASCTDDVQNQGEADRDCGGECNRCPDGARCAQPSDCVSGVCGSFACAEGVELCCQPPLCADGIVNGTETGVDCGGADPACARCIVGRECVVDADCATGACAAQGCPNGLPLCCQSSPDPAGAAAVQCAEVQGTFLPEDGPCLVFVAEARVSWQAAALGCQSRGATLVSIKTSERDAFISSLIDTDIWLGAFDPGTNPASNAFVWRDQTLVDTALSSWAPDEPDAIADQFCVAKSSPSLGGQWSDRPCTELKAYVCELSL